MKLRYIPSRSTNHSTAPQIARRSPTIPEPIDPAVVPDEVPISQARSHAIIPDGGVTRPKPRYALAVHHLGRGCPLRQRWPGFAALARRWMHGDDRGRLVRVQLDIGSPR